MPAIAPATLDRDLYITAALADERVAAVEVEAVLVLEAKPVVGDADERALVGPPTRRGT